MIPQIVKERPLLFWSALLGMLAIVGMLLPVDWHVDAEGGLLGRAQPLDAFSERIVEIDRALQEGRRVQVEAERAMDVHLYLASRRLVRAGDMSHDDMKRAQELLGEMHAQLRREQTPAAKESVRSMWLDRLVEHIPRLDRDEVDREIARLHEQLEANLRTGAE